MLPAKNQSSGMATGFPDTCNTPTGATGTAPITYPNTATDALNVPTAYTVLVSMMPALHQMSKAALTNGMEAGVAHGLYMGMGGHNLGNFKVLTSCMPAINLAASTSGNNYNCSSSTSIVPSICNTLYTQLPADGAAAPAVTLEAPRWDRDLTADDVEQLLADAPDVELVHDDAGVVELRVPAIHGDTARQIAALLRPRAATLREVVLDLRDNPGGLLDAAARVASQFVAPGIPLYAIADDDSRLVATSCDAGLLIGDTVGLTLRVNSRTGSAAEVLAVALQSLGRAVVVGSSRSAGKGAVQVLHHGQWVTVGRVQTPDGREVEGVGVVPDRECDQD
ncbi:MAG: S41 family peptidase [Planctomycetota bacterium]